LSTYNNLLDVRYVVLTYGMAHGIHTKRTPEAAEHTASRYQNDKLMQYQIGKKGP
jgi:hypothetical protein